MKNSIIEMSVIGHIRCCYKEKFGVPRQPGLVKAARAEIILHPPYADPEALDGLEQFSHLWVLFCFHLSAGQQWKPKVRPPRLGGNQSLGVYATRSPFRPNPVGLSVVKLEGIESQKTESRIICSGADIVDGTPVLDIKPYLPYSDSVVNAFGGFASEKPETRLKVNFSAKAAAILEQINNSYPDIAELIKETLTLDPRPQYKTMSDKKIYGIRLYDLDIKWRIENGGVTVEDICHDG